MVRPTDTYRDAVAFVEAVRGSDGPEMIAIEADTDCDWCLLQSRRARRAAGRFKPSLVRWIDRNIADADADAAADVGAGSVRRGGACGTGFRDDEHVAAAVVGVGPSGARCCAVESP